MSAGKLIAVSWLAFVMLILTGIVWSFSNMGDCPQDMTCNRVWWIDYAILGTGLSILAAGVAFIVRRRPK